jgi:nitroreductase
MIHAMQKRISRRSYVGKPLTDDQKKLLEAFIQENTAVPFGSGVGCTILDLPGISSTELKKLGTYGMIKSAYTYLVGHCGDSPRNLEDFGYFFEKVILYATHLGLGTCWLGGTFNRSAFQNRTGIPDTRTVHAVSPVGMAVEQKTIRENVIRFFARGHKRKNWYELFFHETPGTPLAENDAGEYRQVLDMVRIAPSASNKQPWRIIKKKGSNTFHFFLHRAGSYQKILSLMKLPDIQRIDMGIALCHFETVAGELRLGGQWQSDPSSAECNAEDMEYLVSWKGE